MPHLVWSVKSSLLEYVRGMPDGEILVDDGVVETPEGFAFPFASEQDGVRRFRGCVTFQGHSGMMHVELSEPSITRVGDGWRIELADPDSPALRLHFADVHAVVTEADGVERGSGTALTGDGASLFFGPYEAGTALDDPLVRPGA